MSRIDAYQSYQNSYYENQVKQKNETGRAANKDKAERTSGTSKKPVQMSDKAKELLEQLKKKYRNMDFFVADYDSEEEAKSYLSRGSKEYSVLMDPELLEEMANDEETKKKYLNVIDGAADQVKGMKNQLGDDLENVKHLGFTIKDDGTVSYFAELEKSSEQQRERIEAAREEKRAEKQEAAKKAGQEYRTRNDRGVKHTTVYADTIKDLMKKVKDVDWDQIPTEYPSAYGSKFDDRG